MSLRQRAPRVASENGHFHGEAVALNSLFNSSYDKKRVKGRKRDARPWIDLPLFAFFAFMLGISYIAMGGHGHNFNDHGHHLHAVMDATMDALVRDPLPRNLRQARRDSRHHNRDHVRKQTVQQSKEPDSDEGLERKIARLVEDLQRQHALSNDTRVLGDKNNTNLSGKERLVQLDHLEDTELVRKDKQELLNRIRKKQRAGLATFTNTALQIEKNAAQQNNEKEITEKMMISHTKDDQSSLFEAKYQANDWAGSCRQEAKDRMRTEAHTLEAVMQWMADFNECAEKELALELVELNRQISLQARTRHEIAGQLENYTCADPHAPGSPDLSSNVWEHSDGINRVVHVKHDRLASQIHVIDHFISEDECAAMEEAALPKLHAATVADGKGGSKVSDHRKAMQAGIRVPWKNEKDGNPIARLSRRVYDYANYALGLNIDEHGQEDLMSIQYFGRGKDDEHPDRYMPHCDGDCYGRKHHNGTRMATMVVYCTVPELGGSTNFRNAGVHVNPVVGNAIFFSYMDPKSRVSDNRFTEHSGCPVYEGQKKIVTQWIRMGVDDMNPWDSFNTLGIKIKDAREYE